MSSPLHHYVSQLSLRRFGRGKTHQIYVFDKSNGKSFSGAANKLAAERKLYDFEFMGVPVTLEPSLADLESETAQCIESILQRGRLAVQLPEMMKERGTIIRFLATQLVRTAGAFAQQAELGEQLESMLRVDGMPEDYFKPPPEVGTSENTRKANFASHICSANEDLGPALVRKDWVLFQTNLEQPFLLGDNPVALDNLFGGKLGLGVPGVVIYYPLSPIFALGLHCLSFAEGFRREHEKLAGLSDEMLVHNPSARCLPADWEQQRRRWDFQNLVRVILIGLAFVAWLVAFRGLT